MKVILGIFVGILAVVVVLVLVAGYFGFVPGISSIFGSDKPRDLGVAYTHADYLSVTAKDKIQRVDLPADTPPAQSLSFSGSQSASFNITQAEATALLDDNPWPYFAITDCQVRFNSDGTGEIAGILLIDKLHDYAIGRGYTDTDFNNALKYVQAYAVIQKEMPFYVKGTGSVVNGVISFDISKLEIGRLSIPLSQINDHKAALIDAANKAMSLTPGFSVKNFSISGGQVHFEGTLPKTITRSVG
ncbi:MAG: hypothetical protein ABSD79_04650 [Dehalococcoidales bacterium]|jgi:hypothetical protein